MSHPGVQPGPASDELPSAERNLPQFADMPIAPDTANLGQGVELHPLCKPFAPLIGVWRGEGLAQYPSLLGEFPYGQQVTWAHDGRDFLVYEARAWLLSPTGTVLRPAAREVGWWRVDEEEGAELVLAHAFGIVETWYGGATSESSWELETTNIVRTASARETTGAIRLYGLVEEDTLAYAEERALRGLELKPHLSAQLHRVVG